MESLGGAGCVVLGEPDFYARFGFAPEAGLTLPGVPAEYFQALRFNGPVVAGEVAYHAGFNAS